MLGNKLTHHLAERRQQGMHRQRQLTSEAGVINFSSNDYLSLTMDQRVRNAYQAGLQRYPAGSGGSMLVCGYHPVHQALEKAFADALGVDDCLLFSSGYSANLSLINMLGHHDAHVIIDKQVHASIYDGLKLSGALFTRYLHNDLSDLTLKIQQCAHDAVLITESVFSMSGQIAPLAEIARLCKQHDGEALVDEAHAFGVLGPEGLGAVAQQQLTQDDVPLRVIPFGKACAAFGAVIAGQGAWIDALLQSARSQIYSTAISPAFAYGLLETLDIVRCADDRRAKLAELVGYFRQAISHSPLTWRDSLSAIQQLQLGCPQLALSYSTKLREQGIVCLPMRQPTVSRQETGLRVTLNYHHQPEDIDKLFMCLHEKFL